MKGSNKIQGYKFHNIGKSLVPHNMGFIFLIINNNIILTLKLFAGIWELSDITKSHFFTSFQNVFSVSSSPLRRRRSRRRKKWFSRKSRR